MPKKPKKLLRKFYQQDPVAIARRLLGQRLVRILDNGQRLAGTILETEAYLGIPDKAAHTVGGRRTARNQSMWGDGGLLYVYFTYGMHHCLNVVTSHAEIPVAVLIRSLEPTEGMPQMYTRRKVAKTDRDLCRGPARLCQALEVDRQHDGLDLTTSKVMWIEQLRSRALPSRLIGTGPRVGVGYAKEWADKPLRFWVKGHQGVSGTTR